MKFFGYNIERIKLLTCKERRFLKKLRKLLYFESIHFSKDPIYNAHLIYLTFFACDHKVFSIAVDKYIDYAFEKIENNKAYTLKELGL